ncbi:bifunctional DNA primase/polymerase [Arthrobacter sp. HY1533]|uniref:bifunctional DNA primase/polymerase n=1 Tax=Arthrobacter sp. HY1533 TaxID=2970919 RepID=UPI0022B9F094|nr:bifunctional DNA primase/polymerase [Arthrobacter sp. HY1533]
MNYTPAQQAYLAALQTPENIMGVIQAERAVDAEHAAQEARLNAPGALLNAALWYAGQGLLVFPCRPGEKVPATRHGFKEATTDLDQIRTWWHNWPAANVGLPTGHQFDVLDIDGPKGHQSLTILRGRGLLDEPALAVATTPHGTHFYYTPSGDGNTTALAPGIDYRGMGGYVLAAPSRLADGGVYRWTQPLTLGATQ